jgi:hypothetical protein
MTIATCLDLKTAVANWCARSNNVAFKARIPEFISMAETRMMFGTETPLEIKPVRVADMEVTADLVVTNGTATLPANLLELKRFYWPSSPGRRLEYISPRQFFGGADYGTSSPWRYTIEGNTLTVAPGGGSNVIKATYWQRYAPLVADADTNWLLINAPAVYLQGALIEAWGYLQAMDQQQAAVAAYKTAAEGLTAQAARAARSGETLRMRQTMWI